MYNTTWYTTLIKPLFTPPGWIFPPVWIFLYITILAALLIFVTKRTNADKIRGYIYYIIQLLLNVVWSPIFFLLQNPILALVVIILMDIFVVLTIKEFHKVSKYAAYILIPYLIWIFFATYLNLGFVILN